MYNAMCNELDNVILMLSWPTQLEAAGLVARPNLKRPEMIFF